MQIGIPASSDLLLPLFVAFSYAVLALAAYRLLGWVVRRQTTELRQRVALLEHQVARLEDERDDQ